MIQKTVEKGERVEQEVKICLQEVDWTLLKKNLESSGGSVGQEEQTNFYYDTPEKTCLNQGQMVRLRKTSNFTLLTLKSSATLNQGLLRCSETEWSFPACEFLGQELLQSLQNHKNWPSTLPQNLKILGSTRNQRWVFKWQGFCLELDRTQNDQGDVDYELECETDTPKQFLAQMMPLLEKLCIPYKPQLKTKYQRFLDTQNYGHSTPINP
jgi:uncharacterized protein YjbK